MLSYSGTASSHQCCSMLLQELIYVESHLSNTSAKVRASALAGYTWLRQLRQQQLQQSVNCSQCLI
jgi:hypothetical protein